MCVQRMISAEIFLSDGGWFPRSEAIANVRACNMCACLYVTVSRKRHVAKMSSSVVEQVERFDLPGKSRRSA